jgi:glycosyltransferase involved in cell wall biosynthesis
MMARSGAEMNTSDAELNVCALLAVRNEELYLERCLEHLIAQNISICVIDNGSTDSSLEIARRYLGHGVIRIVPYPFQGVYDWSGLLALKETLAEEIDADWFLHHDADEIRYSERGSVESLQASIARADREGFNAIDFDEFVFVPTSDSLDNCGRDYVASMRYYYFFAPRPQHRVNAWKRQPLRVDLLSGGGHRVHFEGLQLSPRPLVLCHYPCLSPAHAKYGQRAYAPDELARGWHRLRQSWKTSRYTPPALEALSRVSADRRMDRTRPYQHHLFMT